MAILVYAPALFASAFLLFWLQPLFAKMALPLLGGSPAVWNTAMMFFQIALLAGYFYAHLLGRLARTAWQFCIHGAVLAAGLAFLPFGIAAGTEPPGDSAPLTWLVRLLASAVGLPFFALSASAPLLQAWFAESRHHAGRDPYFLYAASNLGSLTALLAFPFLLEPLLPLAAESRAWTAGYAILILLVAGCAWLARARAGAPGQAAAPLPAPVRWCERAIWAALAFVPSSLLLGVTAYITTDVAAAPLFWVAPLALYLLSFVWAFGRRQPPKRAWAMKAQALGLVVVTVLVLMSVLFDLGEPLFAAVLFHLGTFFLTALVSHGELARRRPAPEALTDFYLSIAFGGALGGVFNALVAPLIFSSIYEYYLALVAACALRGFVGGKGWSLAWRDLVLPLLLAALVAALAYRASDVAHADGIFRAILLVVLGLALIGFSERPVRFALGVACVLGAAAAVQGSVDILDQERSFFGVNRVKLMDAGRRVALIHGTTIHGAEFTAPDRAREQLTYYARTGPAGQLFAAREGLRAVGVIGLGTGTLACYRKPGEAWTFYEIDGAVARIAGDTRYFHFLADCGGDTRIVLGDGRLSLAREPDGRFDLIVVDAFSSDSIPLHLLTREALLLYLRKLREDGLVLLHVSNRGLDLVPVVAALVKSASVAGRGERYRPDGAEAAEGILPSIWIVVARRERDLAFLDADPRWRPLEPRPGAEPWSDDFSNLLGAIKW